MSVKKYPLILDAPVKDYIWGGTRLFDYGVKTDLKVTAEAWVMSAHKDGESVVANGELCGKTFTEALACFENAVGTNSADGSFPILIKLIDAASDLSVQVHPDDEYALANENSLGKTEMWYIVDAAEGASLVYGFKNDVTKDEFRKAIDENTLTDILRFVPVKKGDAFFIEAGTVHAIGKGLLIAEIQQSSNVTYRVYDYGRVGADGKPRALHIDKAVEVSTLTKGEDAKVEAPKKIEGGEVKSLASCKYFKVEELCLDGKAELLADKTSFVATLITEGEATLKCGDESYGLKKGASVFFPADLGRFTLEGKATVVVTRI